MNLMYKLVNKVSKDTFILLFFLAIVGFLLIIYIINNSINFINGNIIRDFILVYIGGSSVLFFKAIIEPRCKKTSSNTPNKIEGKL